MSVARSYAKALYINMIESESPEAPLIFSNELEKQMEVFLGVLRSSRELMVALLSPLTTTKEKFAILGGMVTKLSISKTLERFLTLLIQKNRLGLLKEIRESFAIVSIQSAGGILGELTSAEGMEQNDIDTLVKSFSKKLSKQVFFKTIVDPKLIAGLRVTVNGITYDGSLRNQLNQLRSQFTLGTAITN